MSPCDVRAECDVWAARLLAVGQRRGGDGEVPIEAGVGSFVGCLLYTSPSPRD